MMTQWLIGLGVFLTIGTVLSARWRRRRPGLPGGMSEQWMSEHRAAEEADPNR